MTTRRVKWYISICIVLMIFLVGSESAFAASGEVRYKDVVMNSQLIVDEGKTLIMVLEGNNEFNQGILVPVGSTLVVKGSGSMSVQGTGFWGCGIGGDHCGTIVIESGTITAAAGAYGIAIGGTSSFERIDIHGGTIVANGSNRGTTIGGSDPDGGIITINGGDITVHAANSNGIYCGDYGTLNIYDGTIRVDGGFKVGIGGGQYSTTTIYGGNVISHGTGNSGAAIGGGTGNKVTINNGTIEAICDTVLGSGGAAIGGDAGHVVIISGGNVTAQAGYYGAAIGGNAGVGGGSIEFNGGTVTAVGSTHDGAAIGGGQNGDGGNVIIRGGNITAKFGTRYKTEYPDVVGKGIGGGSSGTLTIEPERLGITVKVGKTEAETVELPGSPFFKKVEITSDIANNQYFQSMTQESDEDRFDFDQFQYRAKKIVSGEDVGAVGTINEAMISNTPTKSIVDGFQNNGFFSAALTWDALVQILDSYEDPLNIHKETIVREAMYEALILDALEIATVDITNDYVKVLKEDGTIIEGGMKLIDEFIKLEYSFGIEELPEKYKSMDEAKRKQLFEDINFVLGTHLRVEMSGLEKAVDGLNAFFKFADRIFESVETLENYMQTVYTNYCLYCMSDSMKQVINDFYVYCPNDQTELKSALRSCVEVINASAEEFQNKVFFEPAVTESGELILEYFVDSFWKVVTKTLEKDPKVAILKYIYKANRLICEIIGVDPTIEQYYKMLCLLQVRSLAEYVVQNNQLRYGKVDSDLNAKALLDSINTLMALICTDCEYASEMCTIVDDALFNKIAELFSGEDSAEEILKTIEGIKRSWQFKHYGLLTDWINYLEEDYPDSGLYEQFEYLFEREWEVVFGEKWVFSCPVNIFVYDAYGKLVASVENGIPNAEGGILVQISGDTKTLYFKDDTSYQIVIEGYGNGTMDVEIVRGDRTGQFYRRAYFKDVSISPSTVFRTNTKPIEDQSRYVLVGSNTVFANYDSPYQSGVHNVKIYNGYINEMDTDVFLFETEAAVTQPFEITAYVPQNADFNGWISNCGMEIFENPDTISTTVTMPERDAVINAIIVNKDSSKNHRIEAISGPGGTVGGSGTYGEGNYAMVFADPDEGYQFKRWIQDGKEVSTDATYTFIVQGNANLFAEYQSQIISGVLTIEGIMAYGQIIAASVNESGNTGDLTYTWFRDGEMIALGQTYTLTKDDIGKILTCEVTSSVETGSISTTTSVIQKATQDAPVLRGQNETISGKADGRILGLTTDMEISTDGEHYFKVQDPNMLFPVGVYRVRYFETDYYLCSPDTCIEIETGRMLTVTFPSNEGFTIQGASQVEYGSDYSFEVSLQEGFQFGTGFAVFVNGIQILPNNDGICQVKDVRENLNITVKGIELIAIDLPKTGDNSHVEVYVLLTVSCALLIFLAIAKFGKKK